MLLGIGCETPRLYAKMHVWVYHQACSMEKQVHVQYYALLRDERGVGAETLHTGAGTARELYDELRAKHGFSLTIDRLTLAVNDEFAAWDRLLDDKDQVVFIPPVAGG